MLFDKILDSYYEKEREILLFFYYPDDDYVGSLMTEDGFMFVDEIDCSYLFPKKDEREKVMIFAVKG